MGAAMNKEKVRETVAGIIFTSIVGTLSHFVYDWTNSNAIAGLLTPVNESTWEHIKLLFFPMLVYTIYKGITAKENRLSTISSLTAGNLTGCLLIPVLFYTYSGSLGYNLTPADIAIFYISVLAAFCTAFRLRLKRRTDRFAVPLIACALILAVLFFIFTSSPPSIALFKSYA